jgi:hypothetical protein
MPRRILLHPFHPGQCAALLPTTVRATDLLSRFANALVGSHGRHWCRMVPFRPNHPRRPSHWRGRTRDTGTSPPSISLPPSQTDRQNLLRRLPFFPAPPTPEPPRPPQPAPLTFAELSKVQVVCYVPDPESADDPEAEIQPATPARSWDFSRFPYTPHLLKPDQATCAICQDNFTEPETIRRLLYQADPLRLLNCGHVYHVRYSHPPSQGPR